MIAVSSTRIDEVSLKLKCCLAMLNVIHDGMIEAGDVGELPIALYGACDYLQNVVDVLDTEAFNAEQAVTA